MRLRKVDREIQVLKSMHAILDAHIRGKRKYERRKARILSLAEKGLPIDVIAKRAGTFPYYVRYTLRRRASSNHEFSVGTGHMHEQKAEAGL